MGNDKRVTQFFLHSSIRKNFSCVSLCLVQSTLTSYKRGKHPCRAAPSLPIQVKAPVSITFIPFRSVTRDFVPCEVPFRETGCLS